MKNISIKLALIPLLLIPTILSGCNKAKTYREVILEDFFVDFYNTHNEGESLDDNTSISRSYIFVNGAISFDLSPKPGAYFGMAVKLEFDDLVVRIEHTAVPFVWLNHKIITLEEAYYDYKAYSQEDILTIKQMIENKEYDFSFLDLPFVEELE